MKETFPKEFYDDGNVKQLKWDIYFLRIAREVSENSKCLSRKIGAVLVRDNSIISTGYNGPARGVRHCNDRCIDFYINLERGPKGTPFEFDDSKKLDQCPRRRFGYESGKGLHLCQAGHAERNALIQAARNGISTLGTTLYAYCGQICKDCAIELINAGVKELVYLEGPEYDGYSGAILTEGGVLVRKVREDLLCK